MAKERLREDARLISSSDHTLGCDFPIDLHLQRVCARTCLVALLRAPREDFERASIPTQPLKFPCPIQCSAWAVSILVGSVKCLLCRLPCHSNQHVSPQPSTYRAVTAWKPSFSAFGHYLYGTLKNALS